MKELCLGFGCACVVSCERIIPFEESYRKSDVEIGS